MIFHASLWQGAFYSSSSARIMLSSRLENIWNPKPGAHGPHLAIFGKHVGDDLGQLLIACNLDKATVQLCPQALMLRGIDGHRGQFSFVAAMQLAQAADGQDFRFACRVLAFRNQRHFAVVVDEAGAGEPVMRRALGQLQRLEEAQIDASLGELLVEA